MPLTLLSRELPPAEREHRWHSRNNGNARDDGANRITVIDAMDRSQRSILEAATYR